MAARLVLGLAGRALAEAEYSLDRQAARHIQLYKHLLSATQTNEVRRDTTVSAGI